jgi:hypothetical protein
MKKSYEIKDLAQAAEFNSSFVKPMLFIIKFGIKITDTRLSKCIQILPSSKPLDLRNESLPARIGTNVVRGAENVQK